MSENKETIVPELVELTKKLIERQDRLAENMDKGFNVLVGAVNATNAALAETNANLDRLAKLTADGFEGMGKRLDFLTTEVQRLHGHEERIRSLEATVKTLTSRRPRQGARR